MKYLTIILLSALTAILTAQTPALTNRAMQEAVAVKPSVKTDTAASVAQAQPEIAQETVPVAATCQSEIAKYDWSQPVALAVSTAESGLDPGAINNNPATGDYSVGCFQVNIYGALATTRPSEQELKDPVVNVAWAYKIYSGNGKSFIGQWGVCRRGVACY